MFCFPEGVRLFLYFHDVDVELSRHVTHLHGAAARCYWEVWSWSFRNFFSSSWLLQTWAEMQNCYPPVHPFPFHQSHKGLIYRYLILDLVRGLVPTISTFQVVKVKTHWHLMYGNLTCKSCILHITKATCKNKQTSKYKYWWCPNRCLI